MSPKNYGTMNKPYRAITGNPARRTSRDRSKSESGRYRKSQWSRKTRVSVTAQKLEVLDQVAEELGLPRSKVYNQAFRALLKEMGRV
jgi:transcription initiation factor TFIIIB Brf1 subunit/transcription initiation factor TFIIB